MGFKSGKENPINRVKRELARVEKELEEERFKPHLQGFANRLGESILVLLATKAFKDWPEIAKIAFEHEARKSPTSAHFYKLRLPK